MKKLVITIQTWLSNFKVDFRQPLYIYLDDERFPKTKHNWFIVRNYKQFVKAFNKYGSLICYCSFDNDLGPNQLEGYDCAKWLVDKEILLTDFNVHSANPVAQENINCLLRNWEKFKKENQ